MTPLTPVPGPRVSAPRTPSDGAQCNFCLRYPVPIAHVQGSAESARLVVAVCADCATVIGALVPVVATLPPPRVPK